MNGEVGAEAPRLPGDVVNDLEQRMASCEYWAMRLWRWVREMDAEWGAEISNSVLVHMVRNVEGKQNEQRVSLQEKAEVTDVEELTGQVATLKGQIERLQMELAELKKAWPVKPFVPTSFGLSDLSSGV